ncbi:hypothetical protein [Methyloversatilis universalis]|uniref:hypothetical protein n=1 Tax=Methyloversatilis universalis TaxID=378211 RepID=UPI000369AB20|nr:hypothetical protein [Methyloversatilis universalis]
MEFLLVSGIGGTQPDGMSRNTSHAIKKTAFAQITDGSLLIRRTDKAEKVPARNLLRGQRPQLVRQAQAGY